MQSKAFKILLPIGLVLLALAITVVLIKTKPQAQRQAPPSIRPRVTVMTVGAESGPVQVRGYGSVKAKRSVMLVPQVSGEVLDKSVDFESGGFFTRGQVLLEIDDTDYQLALARAQSDLAQAEMNLATAEEEAESAQREWAEIGSRNSDGKLKPPSALVLRKPQLKLARAGLDAARASVKQAQVNLSRCTVTAPFDGRVLNAEADVGQYLRAGNSIGTIYATDIAEISVSVPDGDLAWIKLDPATDPSSEVIVKAEFGGAVHTWPGRAVRLGGAVDARSRLVPVVVEVDNPYERAGQRPPLVEGMFVEVSFSTASNGAAVVIPRTALRPGNLVWIVNDQDKLNILPVEVSRAGIHEALIRTGLEPGMNLVTSNLQFVTQGMLVQVEGRSPKGPQPLADSSSPPADKGGE